MTEIAQLIQSESDPTWEQASLYASRYLDLPGPFAQLVRSGFQSKLDQVEFIRLLGGTRMNVGCLLQAAEIYADGRKPDVNYVMRALDQLGLPYATVVIAINLVTRLTLKRKPPGIWRGLLREAMTSVEVGVRLGEKVGSIGRHGGALMGFARYAGLQILMMHDRNAFKEWRRQEKINGKIGRKVEISLFGCEPYQVSAIALQQLGFGVSAAAGAALGVGQLEASQLSLGDDLLRWKSAVLWIDALRRGRDVPADPAVRSIFPEIAPAKNRGERNIALSVLYTEIAKAKGEGSDWVWHLPLPSYEKTAEEWHLE